MIRSWSQSAAVQVVPFLFLRKASRPVTQHYRSEKVRDNVAMPPEE
jgi:hypothetical protein